MQTASRDRAAILTVRNDRAILRHSQLATGFTFMLFEAARLPEQVDI